MESRAPASMTLKVNCAPASIFQAPILPGCFLSRGRQACVGCALNHQNCNSLCGAPLQRYCSSVCSVLPAAGAGRLMATAMAMATATLTDRTGVVVGMADAPSRSIIPGKTTSSGIPRISTISGEPSTAGDFMVVVSMAVDFMVVAEGMGPEQPILRTICENVL
jgi:hypothetical protein